LKLTIKVRDKIVADGLEDKTFDVTNIGIHLKATELKELQQVSKNLSFQKCVNEIASSKAVAGDTCTFKVLFRIRLSAKLYKIIV
jgi:predicted sulfurtransferase